MLLKASRRALHRRAAAWFEGQRRSPPCRASGAGRGSRGGRRLSRRRRAAGGGVSLRAGAPAWWRGASPWRPRTPARAALTCLQGEILHDLGAMASFARSLRGGARRRRRSRAPGAPRLARPRGGQADDRRAGWRVRRPRIRGAEVARQHDLVEQLAASHFLRGNLYFPRGRIEDCLREHQQSLEGWRDAAARPSSMRRRWAASATPSMRAAGCSPPTVLPGLAELCLRHGFGRVEVANLPIAAIARIDTYDLAGPWRSARGARRGGTVRPSARRAIACHAVYFCAMSRRDLAQPASTPTAPSSSRGASAPGALKPNRSRSSGHPWQAGARAEGVALLREAAGYQPRERDRPHRPMLLGNARASPTTRRSGARRWPRPRRCSRQDRSATLSMVLSRGDRNRPDGGDGAIRALRRGARGLHPQEPLPWAESMPRAAGRSSPSGAARTTPPPWPSCNACALSPSARASSDGAGAAGGARGGEPVGSLG